MDSPSLQDLERLAVEHVRPPDLRPDWLRALDTDPAGTYYRYFFEFARRYRPGVFLEVGTCEGKAAAHMAAGHPEGLVVTLDIKEQAKRLTESLRLPNVVPLVGHSLELPKVLRYMPRLDALFIDADHSFEAAGREYVLYRRFVRPGGVIFFDDIHLNGEMQRLWTAIPERKAELPGLHESGFGCAIKDDRVPILGELARLAGEAGA